MHIIRIDPDLCISCRKCVDCCFVNVIRWDEVEGKPYSAYPEDCQICTYCERICPVNAIEIVPDWESRHKTQYLTTERR
jgi:NAD-dependent dihydropyrimidine dehydrogenase PreA subunit